METWDAITSRRNVREFADRPVALEDLDRILEAARRTPSAKNWQPWDFVAVTGRDRLGELSKVWVGAGHVAGAVAAVALIAPVPGDERERRLIQFDLGQVSMSIMLAAADLGIGSCHAGVGEQDLARQLLGLPEDRFCAYLVSLGYPAGRPLAPIQRPDRRPFDDVVHRDRW
jgi:nitroreductase